MDLRLIAFFVLSSLSIAAALGLVLMRNVVYGALCLGFCLTMVAGLYALLGADFVFAAQILIYVTAIAVIFLFAVLLAGRRVELTAKPFNATAPAAALVSLAVFVMLGSILWSAKSAWGFLTASPSATTAEISALLMGPYALGVEILGVMLLASLVGAVIFARSLAVDKEERK